jgi:chromosome segregation ATPase
LVASWLLQVEKEKEALRMELNKAKQQIKEADNAISSQKAEIEKLNHIINEADQVGGASCLVM